MQTEKCDTTNAFGDVGVAAKYYSSNVRKQDSVTFNRSPGKGWRIQISTRFPVIQAGIHVTYDEI